jgi:hypothetical protein
MTATTDADVAIYQHAAVDGYQSGLVMTPEQAKAQDDELRRCMRAVLREGVDYGAISGTDGKPTLWRPGAQKMMQWFGLGFTCDRIGIERDDQGRKHGIDYRCTVTKRLPDGTDIIKATCEGTADYDESKFYQDVETVKARLRELEHKWAAKDRRVPNADRWNSAKEYRADWNALMKRSQKRAIVGAVVDATAAGGIFSADDEDDTAPVTDDEPTWYEQALEHAVEFTDVDEGRALYVEAAQAHRNGLCTRRQQDRIQNIIKKRGEQLKTVKVVDVEDLARQAQTSSEGAQEEAAPGDQPGSISKAQLTKLHIILAEFGFTDEEREQKLVIAEIITGRAPLTGPAEGRSSKNLSQSEASRLIDTLDGFDGDRDKLIAYMADREDGSDE